MKFISLVDEEIVSIDDNGRGITTIQKYRLDGDLLDLHRSGQLQKTNECVIRIRRDMIAESRKEMTGGERQMLRAFMSRQSPFSLMARIYLEKTEWLNQ